MLWMSPTTMSGPVAAGHSGELGKIVNVPVPPFANGYVPSWIR
jgi:hypothetical protein